MRQNLQYDVVSTSESRSVSSFYLTLLDFFTIKLNAVVILNVVYRVRTHNIRELLYFLAYLMTRRDQKVDLNSAAFMYKNIVQYYILFSRKTIEDYLKLSLFHTGCGLYKNWHSDLLVLLRKRI